MGRATVTVERLARPRHYTGFAALALLLGGALPMRAQDSARLPGFTPAASAAQRVLEARFLAVLSSASAERTVRELAREPHPAGTDASRRVAERLAGELRRLGFETTLERFDVYLPQPRRARLTLVGPDSLDLPTREPGSPHTGAGPDWLLAWNAYSANGVIEAPLVYANYATVEDFRTLSVLGIDVRGNVVLARYGRIYRGAKVAAAEERGAAGVILYSDPAEDGYGAGDTLPVGPYRPARAVQRGTVARMWLYTGDPLTPGAPSVPGVARLDPSAAANLPRIPVLPIGYAAAEGLLRALRGPAAPRAFQGALPLTYHVGPGTARVRLDVEQKYATRPIWNVIARLRGRTDQDVVVGNHHDAWLYGGVDPHSGTAAVMELARGLAELRRGGWVPRRGITLAFWDAEEPGVVGSTEWVERHVTKLRERAVAYLNVDVFTAGTLDVAGSHSLRELVLSAARDVADPLTRRPLAGSWLERQRTAWSRRFQGVAAERREPFRPELGEIGAGSDWTAFLHFAGVPSLQWTMNGRGAYAVYHSALDDAAYAARFADSAFVYTPAFAGALGLATLRLAEADVPAFRYSDYLRRIGAHLAAAEAANLDALGQPRLTLDLAPMRTALDAALASARRLEAWVDTRLVAGDSAGLRSIAAQMPRLEQLLLSETGLPGRPWYKHRIHAPGRETGYDPLPLPELAEALQARDGAAAAVAVSGLSETILRLGQRLDALLAFQ